MKWFMSYTYKVTGANTQAFECCVTERDEHPVETVNRWNKTHTDRITVLVSFQQVPDETPEMDVGFWIR